jgi:hypothetical protein
MKDFASLFIAIFGRCPGTHIWNSDGTCEHCEARCYHPAWVTAAIEGSQPVRRVTTCMRCGMDKRRRETKVAVPSS